MINMYYQQPKQEQIRTQNTRGCCSRTIFLTLHSLALSTARLGPLDEGGHPWDRNPAMANTQDTFKEFVSRDGKLKTTECISTLINSITSVCLLYHVVNSTQSRTVRELKKCTSILLCVNKTHHNIYFMLEILAASSLS